VGLLSQLHLVAVLPVEACLLRVKGLLALLLLLLRRHLCIADSLQLLSKCNGCV
jgi:hypothetical protein